jgi:hypothetical protein
VAPFCSALFTQELVRLVNQRARALPQFGLLWFSVELSREQRQMRFLYDLTRLQRMQDFLSQGGIVPIAAKLGDELELSRNTLLTLPNVFFDCRNPPSFRFYVHTRTPGKSGYGASRMRTEILQG